MAVPSPRGLNIKVFFYYSVTNSRQQTVTAHWSCDCARQRGTLYYRVFVIVFVILMSCVGCYDVAIQTQMGLCAMQGSSPYTSVPLFVFDSSTGKPLACPLHGGGIVFTGWTMTCLTERKETIFFQFIFPSGLDKSD